MSRPVFRTPKSAAAERRHPQFANSMHHSPNNFFGDDSSDKKGNGTGSGRVFGRDITNVATPTGKKRIFVAKEQSSPMFPIGEATKPALGPPKFGSAAANLSVWNDEEELMLLPSKRKRARTSISEMIRTRCREIQAAVDPADLRRSDLGHIYTINPLCSMTESVVILNPRQLDLTAPFGVVTYTDGVVIARNP